jgi:hypothetical protein
MAKRKYSNKSLKGRSRWGGEPEVSSTDSFSNSSQTQVSVPAQVPEQVPEQDIAQVPTQDKSISEKIEQNVVDAKNYVVNTSTKAVDTVKSSLWVPSFFNWGKTVDNNGYQNTSSCKKSSWNLFDTRPLCQPDNGTNTLSSVGGKRHRKRTRKNYHNKKLTINTRGLLKVRKTKNITLKRLHTKRR